jgi:hypothetical protein
VVNHTCPSHVVAHAEPAESRRVFTVIEATERKLRETQFFLRLLTAESKKAARNDPESFGFYVSAILSAGRSVTFALQKEEKAKYDAWFPQWWAGRSEDERKLSDFLKGQRNLEQHEDGAPLNVEWEYVPVSQHQQPALEPVTKPRPDSGASTADMETLAN